MAEKKSFNLYKSWEPMIQAMQTDAAGLLFKAIYTYQTTGEEPPTGASFYPMFALFKAKFDEDDKEYIKKCDEMKRLAEDREAKRNSTHRKRAVTNRKRTVTNEEHTVTDTDIDTDTDKDTDIDKKKVRACKHRYGEYDNVLLTDEDRDKLINEFPDDWKQRVDNLSRYMKSTGKTYKDHLATIRNWARRDKSRDRPESIIDKWKNA